MRTLAGLARRRPAVPAPVAATTSGRRPGRSRTALMVGGTLAVAVLCYSLNQAVAEERRELRRLAARNLELAAATRALEAELRVRMRLPQLQSWNDGILGLRPITAAQHVRAPAELAVYALGPAAAPAPGPRLAVREGPAPAPAAPRLVARDLPGALPRAAAPAPAAAQPAPLVVAALPPAAPAPEPPSDLLRLVEAEAPPRAP